MKIRCGSIVRQALQQTIGKAIKEQTNERKTLYFSSLCPDTVPFKAAMERLSVTAREVDITASMRNLKILEIKEDNEEVFFSA